MSFLLDTNVISELRKPAAGLIAQCGRGQRRETRQSSTFPR